MTYEAFETIKVAVDGALAIVTVAREAALNALSSQVISELTAASGELEVSTDVRVVILTGAGEKAFVAGADIAEMRDLSPLQAQAFAEMGGTLAHSIETSEKPWIAAVSSAITFEDSALSAASRATVTVASAPSTATWMVSNVS